MRPILCLLLIATILLWGCSSADSLGDEPAREVTVSGSPTWDNGMRELISLKCAYCHTVPRPDIAPDEIIADLDLSVYDTRVENGEVIRGADAIGRWLADGILDHGLDIYQYLPPVTTPTVPSYLLVARQMPLDYGTPVSDSEKGLFAAWSANGSPRNDSTQPDGNAELGAALYDDYCSLCHEDSGPSQYDGGGANAFIDGAQDPTRWIGPPIRSGSVTVEKIKSMWLHKALPYLGETPVELSTEQAAHIRAYLQTILP